MAHDSEEKPSRSRDFSSKKAALCQIFNDMKKWREEQFEQFRNHQYLESNRMVRLSVESPKQFEKILGNASKGIDTEERPKILHSPENSSFSTLKNDVGNYDTLQESSLTGHLKRCFDDSSTSSLALSENKENHVAKKATVFNLIQNSQNLEQNFNVKQDQQVKMTTSSSSSAKPKRPFLKKGTGLLRYMPKSSPSDQEINAKGPFVHSSPIKKKGLFVHNSPMKKSSCMKQTTLKLKPAIRKTDIPSQNAKHIRFDIPATNNEESGDFLAKNYEPKTSELFENVINDDDKDKSSYSSSISPDHHAPRNNELDDISNSEIDTLNLLKEDKELTDFEMLEDCVQNSSFNSDSSVVQRILHGDTTKPLSVIQEKSSSSSNVSAAFKEIFKNPVTSIFSAPVSISKCLEEARRETARKENLQKIISDINPRIQSLQREISRTNQEPLDDCDITERCSTPVENLNMGDRITPTLSENYSDLSFPKASSARFGICQNHCKACNIDDDNEDLMSYNNNNLHEEASISEESDVETENQHVSDDRSKIRDKMKELEKEIEIYQKLNSKLQSRNKEKNEFLSKLQKEQEEFYKYMEAEKKKLQDEIDEKQRQIKRQKETFNRYQKLRKDNPTRKEREELNALRQEVDKLQEELKRQKIKYTSDSRKWKNQLETAERERDGFKLENVRLEEQCQDLLTALKARMKKRPDSKISGKTDNGAENENLPKVFPIYKDAECQTEIKYVSSDQSKNTKPASPQNTVRKTKVHFNISPEREKNDPESVIEDTVKSNVTEDAIKSNIVEDSVKSNVIEDRSENTLKDDFQPAESTINVDYCQDRNEEKSTEPNMSNISVSAECECREIDYGYMRERIYNTGERELVFLTGIRKTISVDGKIKVFFPKGDIKEIFPDKHEIYRYENGIIVTSFPDGLEVTEFTDGRVQKCFPDGKKRITFPDGTIRIIFPDGSEESRSAQGNAVKLGADGTETIEFANGQKEIKTATYTRREFTDGAVKIYYKDGKQETRFPNGRVRIKNKEGKIIIDTKYQTKD